MIGFWAPPAAACTKLRSASLKNTFSRQSRRPKAKKTVPVRQLPASEDWRRASPESSRCWSHSTSCSTMRLLTKPPSEKHESALRRAQRRHEAQGIHQGVSSTSAECLRAAGGRGARTGRTVSANFCLKVCCEHVRLAHWPRNSPRTAHAATAKFDPRSHESLSMRERGARITP